MKLASVVGARPQFIKAIAVSRAIVRYSNIAQEILIHTGQHYDTNMSDIFFRELNMDSPHYNLGVGSGSHAQQTAKILTGLEEIFIEEKPDYIITYGDTNSTLAAALAASKLHIPVAHVEAGLRSWNRNMPEEVNRIITDHVSNLLFTPTESASDNLRREGISSAIVHLVGDVMYDSAIYYASISEKQSSILTDLQLQPKKYILATIHRAENTDISERLQSIFDALLAASKHIRIVIPLHPRTANALSILGFHKKLQEIDSNKFSLIDPIGYLDMISLEKGARMIITDSGGIQKEAYFHKTPCITLRNETEWIELVELGVNRLVPPTNVDEIYNSIIEVMNSPLFPDTQSGRLYGEGMAAERIVRKLQEG